MADVNRNGSEQAGVFTTAGLARYLECKPPALVRMRRENRGPRWTRVGRLVRYPISWVKEWIQENEGSTSVPTGAPGCEIAPNAPETGGPDGN